MLGTLINVKHRHIVFTIPEELRNFFGVDRQRLKILPKCAANILTDKNIIEAANLKETSLYELAVKANLENPREFVKRFIEHDRRARRT